jgi:hypothetical protein
MAKFWKRPKPAPKPEPAPLETLRPSPMISVGE